MEHSIPSLSVWILQGTMLLWTVGTAEEVCNLETFRPTCSAGHVILITRAQYGRMKVGRCLKRDYYVGCGADVTSILHEHCSGKPSCALTTPSTDLYDRQKCPKDLVSYLDVEYRCPKVSDFSNVTCKGGKKTIPIGNGGGYIAGQDAWPPSSIQRPPRGRVDCPSIELRASIGQKINITLYEFSTKDSTAVVPNHGHYQCTVFATIREYIPPSPRETVICGSGTHRQELVYTSKSNQITIELTSPGSAANQNGHRFLLEYIATGCPDPEIPQDMMLNRRNEQLDVRCNHTGQVWHLVCRDNNWVGKFGNCSTDYDTYYDDTAGGNGSGFPNGIVMAIIVGIVLGVMIGFCLLLVVYNIRRKRRKHSRSSTNAGDRQVQIKTPKHVEGIYGPEDPMLPVMNPDVTLDKGCHVICDVTGTLLARGRVERDHVYEKPQSGMEVQCLLQSSGQTKTQQQQQQPFCGDEDTIVLKTLDSGDYGCQFHSHHQPWHIRGDTMEIVHPSQCALPT